ncbi:hypothetical protein PsAD26_03028 [Pseudovibrio sp. Ad26]|nr:hypothetical protein PsAD26_03028 [Pseudovibrio sp. Ad26]
MEAYTAALNGADAPPKKKREENTLGWLIDQYLSSPEFSSLKESTQAVKTSFLNNIAKESGHHPLEAIDASTIQGGRDKRASTPGAANNFLKHMSAMYKWAISDKNIPITKNPTRDVPRETNQTVIIRGRLRKLSSTGTVGRLGHANALHLKCWLLPGFDAGMFAE